MAVDRLRKCGNVVVLSEEVGVHRRLLYKWRKQLESREPGGQAPEDLREFTLGKAPRKQRHTAHRIWARIQSELPDCKIAERTVREYVHDRKVALGLIVRETHVPQSYQ
jgi:transposase-like protein